MAPVTAERLAALLGECTRVKGSDEPPPTDGVPPGYSHRRGWRPRTTAISAKAVRSQRYISCGCPRGWGGTASASPTSRRSPCSTAASPSSRQKPRGAVASDWRRTRTRRAETCDPRVRRADGVSADYARDLKDARSSLSKKKLRGGDSKSDVFVDAIVRAFLDAMRARSAPRDERRPRERRAGVPGRRDLRRGGAVVDDGGARLDRLPRGPPSMV